MKHRIFVALPVSSEIKKNILLWQKSHSDLPFRWISPHNLHITLIPPWYTEDIPSVHKQLKKIVKQHLIHLCFHTIAVGPNNHSPRLIWIEGKGNNQLNVLRHQAELILDQQPGKRTFIPHITIGRLKKGKEGSCKKFSEKISWCMDVKTYCLIESHLKRDGAQYRIIQTYR